MIFYLFYFIDCALMTNLIFDFFKFVSFRIKFNDVAFLTPTRHKV